MSANLYDILDVDESASVEEIRAAWKSAVADLDPTDRRFRAYNDAAAVLLDADKRAAYDAELAADRGDAPADVVPADELAADDAPAEDAPGDDGPGDGGPGADGPADATVVDGDAREEPEAAGVTLTKDTSAPATPTTEAVPAPKPGPKPAAAQAGPPGWALLAAGVGAFVALVLAVVLALLPGGIVFADQSPKDVAASEKRFEESRRSVEAAAERMIADVFSYNYETMDADLERAQQYVTPELGAKQAKGWPDIAKDAADQKLVVQARAEAVALTRLSPDGETATVVVFLVQASTRNGVDQTPLRMWVSLKMLREDGSADAWLIDDVCVDSTCDQGGS